MLQKTRAPDRQESYARDRYDAIVVGAGIGGLTTAAMLAKRGLAVLVLEMHYELGGCATVFDRVGKNQGYQFDVGLHYIGDCEAGGLIPRILDAAGVEPIEFIEQDPDGFDTLHFPDFVFKMPRGIERFRERLKETFPAEVRGIDRYISLLYQVWTLMGVGAAPLKHLHRLPGCLMALRHSGSTLALFLDTCTRDPRLRAVLAGQLGVYHQPPSRASLMGHAGVTMHFLQGSFYPAGGGAVLSDRLANVVESHGGKILLRAKVDRVAVEGGRVRAVHFSSPHLGPQVALAPIVVSNADLKHTMLDLVEPGALPNRLLNRTRNFEMSPAMGVVYLGVKRDFQGDQARNSNLRIYPGHDYEHTYSDAMAGRFSERPHVFVGNATLKDPGNPEVAPPGVHNLQLMSLAPSQFASWGVTPEGFRDGTYRHDTRYKEIKQQFADALIRETERVLPGLRDQIVFQEVSTPLTVMRYTGASNGTSYGISLVPWQFMHHRPSAKTPVKGLFLCGASLRTGHGIFGAMASGVEAAAAILGAGVKSEVLGRKFRIAV